MTENNYAGKGDFARGVHPPDAKEFARNKAIEVLPLPTDLIIPLLQHAGAPANPTVKMREEVATGTLLAEAGGFISAAVHSPVNGVVGKESKTTLANGRRVPMLPVKAQGDQLEGDALLQDVLGGSWTTQALDQFDPDKIVESIKNAGIVGQGGAAFPTFVKFLKNEEKPVDTLLLNGCECEPYLCADYRMMLEHPDAVVSGALLAARACGAKNIFIAVEDNKRDCAEALATAAKGSKVQIAVVHTKYPMGGEKQTVLAVTGKAIPTGGLPLDVGAVVINVGTSIAIARAVLRNKALTHRVVTVTGAGITEPKNLLVPIGVRIQELIDYCGGLTADAARVISGGPMMGFTMGALNAVVTKGTSGITVLTKNDIQRSEETNCVRCGHCVDVCPLNLVPTKLALAARHRDWELAGRYHMNACMECGCCAYACPAGLPLVQLIRMGKVEMRKAGI